MAYNWKKFLHGIENYGLASADTALSSIGATNVIKPEMYIGENKNKWAKAGDIGGAIGEAALPLAMNFIAPGSGQIVSAAQKGVNSATTGNVNGATSNLGQAGVQGFNFLKDANQAQDITNTMNMFSNMPMAFGGMYNSKYCMPMGGPTQMMPELEKQEMFRTPQGQIRQVDAPTHAGGGTGPMNLPDNTNVLSDRLKTKRGKTFAEEGKNLDTTKWEKILDTSTDPYKKATAKKMIEASNRKMNALYAEQELAKGNLAGAAHEEITNTENTKMAGGGSVNFKSGAAYKKWLAYGHATGVFERTPGNQSVSIKGNQKTVEHAGGGLTRGDDFGSKNKPYPSVKSNEFAGGNRSYPIPTKADAVDALRLAGLHNRPDVRTKVFAKYPELNKMPNGGTYNTTQPTDVSTSNFYDPFMDVNGFWVQNTKINGQPWYRNQADKDANKPATRPALMPDGKGGWIPYQPITNQMPMGGVTNTDPIKPVPMGQTHPLNTGYKATNLYGNNGEQLFIGPGNIPVPYSQIQAKPISRGYSQAGPQYSGVVGYDPSTGIATSKMPVGGTYNVPEYDPYAVNQPYYNSIPVTDPNNGLTYTNPEDPGLAGLTPRVPVTSDAPNKFNNFVNSTKNALNTVNPYFAGATAGNFLGPVYDIYRGARGGDAVNFDRINPDLVDYSQARKMGVQETNRGFNQTADYLKNATAGNAGAYLGNITAANAQRDKLNQNTISQSIQDEQNANATIKNSAKVANATTQQAESIARQQEKDIAKNTLSTGLYNFGAALNQYGTDMQLKGNEPALRALIATGDYDYQYDAKGKPIGITYKGSNKTTWFTGLNKQQLKDKANLEANLPK
jgi:hypothetical protein